MACGPYRVMSVNEPDMTIQKVYLTKSHTGQIQVDLSRFIPFRDDLPPGYTTGMAGSTVYMYTYLRLCMSCI